MPSVLNVQTSSKKDRSTVYRKETSLAVVVAAHDYLIQL